MAAPVLEVKNLCVEVVSHGGRIQILKDINFAVEAKKTIGLVGESGSGKSMTASSIMRLLPQAAKQTSGSILLNGLDLTKISEKEMRDVRGNQIGMIFQEPMTALDPTFSVGSQVAQGIRIHTGANKRVAWEQTVKLLDRVGIPNAAERATQHPHQFSGGMRQRVVIAMALACEPRLLLADEPTTALDVTVQAQILDLLKELSEERGVALVFISHDLGVIADICDDVGVMYKGELVETGNIFDVMYNPQHEYTVSLLEAAKETSGMKGAN